MKKNLLRCPLDDVYKKFPCGYIGLDDKWYDGLKRLSSKVVAYNNGLEITHLKLNESLGEAEEISYWYPIDVKEYKGENIKYFNPPITLSIKCEEEVNKILNEEAA